MAENGRPYQLIVVLLMVAAGSWLLPYLVPYDPIAISIPHRLLAPSWTHLLGTDDLGRDLLSRILYGLRATLTISIFALLSSLALGLLLGGIAGYYFGAWPDRLIMWVADILNAIPFLVLLAGILAIWGGGLAKAYFVLAAVMWTNTARLVRGEVIRIMPLDWIAGDRVAGLSEFNILFRKVLPKCLGPAVVFAVAFLPDIIALEAGLSFLGLGLQPPSPGLGRMVFEGINYLGSAWWMCIMPSTALMLTVAGVQIMRSFSFAPTGKMT